MRPLTPSLSSFFLVLFLPSVRCMPRYFMIECYSPPPIDNPRPQPPPLSADDCRFLLAQIPSLPLLDFPFDSPIAGDRWNPFQVVIRHRACVAKLYRMEIISPTVRLQPGRPVAESEWHSGSITLGPGDWQATIFQLARGLRDVGERIVRQCVEGRGWKGHIQVSDVWGSRHVQFRVKLGWGKAGEQQDAEIQRLRTRIEVGAGQDAGAAVQNPRGFSTFYFEV